MRPALKKYTQANREAWNEVMPRHQEAARAKWDDAFLQPGFVCLDEIEVGLLRKMGIKGKAVAHLCCNNGVELLSLKNLGAGPCVGFDISDAAIQEARERAQGCRIDCQFVRTDVYDISREYENRFEVVYISAGGLGWIPDLKLFFAKAAALLQENGRVFIHETHPFSEMLPFDDDKAADPLRIVDSYFQDEPIVEYGGLDYVGGSKYVSSRPQYWFVHTVSDILMGLVEIGISLEHFSEYEMDVSAGHKRVEAANSGIPLSFILIGRKQNAR